MRSVERRVLRSVIGNCRVPASAPLQVAALLCAATLTAPCVADIIHVPGDFATIQAAVDAAMPGDEIVVGPGEYLGAIVINGKALTIRSERGPDVTELQHPGTDVATLHVIDVLEGVLIIEGFTFRGTESSGINARGLRGESARVEVRHCRFIEHVMSGSGAAIVLSGPENVIAECKFQDNHAKFGGAVAAGDNTTITNCTFVNNHAEQGGALFCVFGFVDISQCVFVGNSAAFGGAAFVLGNGQVDFDACDFTGNGLGNRASGVAGGALYLNPASSESVALHVMIDNCNFHSNAMDHEFGGGGAVAINLLDDDAGKSTIDILNCHFTRNKATSGSGLFINGRFEERSPSTSIHVAHTTFTDHAGASQSSSIIHSIAGQFALTLKNVAFTNQLGPGIAMVGIVCPVGNVAVDVRNSQFIANETSGPTSALGIFDCGDLSGPVNLNVEGTTFASNSTSRDGAVLHIGRGVVAAIAESLFCANEPQTIDGVWTDGGGNEFLDDCPIVGDLNGDRFVNGADLALLLGDWSACADCENCPADLDDDCAVTGTDLAILLGNWQ